MGGAALDVREVRRTYQRGHDEVHALDGIDLRVAPGELLAVHGRSGAGKTTLLNVLGGLDRPTAGTVVVDGVDLADLDDDGLVALRRDRIAYVFQTFGLLPVLSAAENVEVPLRLAAAAPAERDARVHELLDRVGLAGRARHRPHELSGGEQQRVAIARALANRPSVLLADEPTGQLDSATGRRVMELLREIVDQDRVTAVVATHDPALMDLADTVVELRDGRIVAAGSPATP